MKLSNVKILLRQLYIEITLKIMVEQLFKEFKEAFAALPAASQLEMIKELRDLAMETSEAEVIQAKETLSKAQLIEEQLKQLK